MLSSVPTEVMLRTFLSICCAVLVPSLSAAGTIVVGDFKWVNVGYYSPVTDGQSRAVLGSVDMSRGRSISPGIDGMSFEAYCVDILGPIFDPGRPQPPATFDATAAPLATWDLYVGAVPAAGRYAAWLYNRYAEDIAASNIDLERTALLMAIWNVLFDDDFTVGTGDFRVSAIDVAVQVSADAKLAELADNLPAAMASDATWLQLQDCSTGSCVDVQDFVGPLPQSTPEPGTAGLVAMGLLGAGLVRRRGRRDNR